MASDYWSSVQSKSASARKFMDHFAALLAVVYIGAQSPYTIPGGSELTCRFGHASAGADVQCVAVWWLPSVIIVVIFFERQNGPASAAPLQESRF